MTQALRCIPADARTSSGNPYFPASGHRPFDSIEPVNTQMQTSFVPQEVPVFCLSPTVRLILRYRNTVSVVFSTAHRPEIHCHKAISDKTYHELIQTTRPFVEGPSGDTAAYADYAATKSPIDFWNDLTELDSIIDSIERGVTLERSASIMELAARASAQASQGPVDLDAWAAGLARDVADADD